MTIRNGIMAWIEANGWTNEGSRHGGAECYANPAGGFLTIQSDCDVEAAFWSYYAPGNEDSEQADQTGLLHDVPTV